MSFQRRFTSAVVAAAALVFSFAPSLSAAVITYKGADPAAGPGDPRPNSNTAAASFDAAVGALGAVGLINFENAPLGNFGSLAIAPGITAVLTGTASEGGIRTTPTLFGGQSPEVLGYNTTAGGQQFLSIVPVFDIGTARLTLNFTQPIQAFGSYVAGFEGFNSDLLVTFNDGSNQNIPISGSSGGGAQFFGFTDAGAQIVQIAMELRNITGPRDIFCLDDIRFVAVPEPASIVFAIGIGAIGLFARHRRLTNPV